MDSVYEEKKEKETFAIEPILPLFLRAQPRRWAIIKREEIKCKIRRFRLIDEFHAKDLCTKDVHSMHALGMVVLYTGIDTRGRSTRSGGCYIPRYTI